MSYASPPGGLPGQTVPLTGRAVFTEAYAVIPAACMTDIVTSRLPHWDGTRAWVLARPLTGFAETFCQIALEIAAGGGSDRPEPDPAVESALFVAEGAVTVTVGGAAHALAPGGLAFLPAGAAWTLRAGEAARLHWIRKRYEPVDGIAPPDPVIADETAIAPTPMPDTDGAWATTLFTDPADLRHDMAVTVVTLMPGARIPFEETHVMEHGLTVLSGRGVYRLNRDWVEVGPGDFMWLRAFCPQACCAAGPEPFRYLLYKDINRMPRLWSPR